MWHCMLNQQLSLREVGSEWKMPSLVWGLITAALFFAGGSAQYDPRNMVTFDEKFVMGVKAYAQDKWSDAIIYISQAMDGYKQLEKARLDCFKSCAEGHTHHTSVPPRSQFFLEMLQMANCIRLCEESRLGMTPWGGVSHSVLDQLKSKEGYNYLQLSLYKEGKLKEAARTSSTYNYFNPRNINIKKNLHFYKSLKQVTEDDLIPLETLKYRDLFNEGHGLFYARDWKKMVNTFEESLGYFYTALDDCKTLCDGSLRYDTSKILDFSQVISSVYLERLDCRVKCVKELGDFREDKIEDFFGTYFHYLQQGYHFLNDSLQALQSSSAHVQLEPTNEVAERNSVFYLRQPGVTRKDFNPREDVVPEVKKRVADLNALKTFADLSGHTSKETEELKQGQDEMDEILLEEDFQKYPVGHSVAPLPTKPLPLLTMETIKPVVVQTSADFDGVERLVVDDLLTETQCQDLMQLASFGNEGDGYQRKSPHTTKEKFEGLHILDAAKRAVSGEFNRHLSWLYLNSSSVVKDIVAKEFSLPTPLYFSYTHLVCRTALEGMQSGRNDLSHPVHSDNCILNEATGECHKLPPAYTWRDYSAILYLNGEFEGGEFFFAHSTKDLTPDVRVRPKCGRMVGFSAGKENMHGVTAVTKGRRCAVALWFTLDHDHKEETFDTAANLLKS